MAVGGLAAVCLVLAVLEVNELGVGQVEEVVHEVAERVRGGGRWGPTGGTYDHAIVSGPLRDVMCVAMSS